MEPEMDDRKLLANLSRKMLLVMDKVDHIEKLGDNLAQRYKYVTEADTVAKIRRAMIEAKLGVFFSATCAEYVYETDTRSGGKMRVLRVNLKVTWVDAETGFSQVEFFDGEGSDTGDKAVYKAMTGAEKYALLKTFLIPTGDDPEKEEKEKAAEKPAPASSEKKLEIKPEAPRQTETKYISEGQRKLLWAKMKEVNAPSEDFYGILSKHGAQTIAGKLKVETLPASSLTAALKEVSEWLPF